MRLSYSKKDFYTKKAKEENYPARSVYKLKEIDKKYGLIKKGDVVLDLGCAPGSWLLYISEKVSDNGKVIGADMADIKINLPKNAEFIKGEITKIKISDRFDVVVSDLSPSTSGINFVDTGYSLELCAKALETAEMVLNPGGNFLCKIFEGEGIDEFFKTVKQNFKFAKRFRPKATRKESREIYIIGKGYEK